MIQLHQEFVENAIKLNGCFNLALIFNSFLENLNIFFQNIKNLSLNYQFFIVK
jgi:hypothetical protein